MSLDDLQIECIGDGHGGCDWRGIESDAESHPCRYLFSATGLIDGFEIDEAGEDTVWLCPQCGGECSFLPLDEQSGVSTEAT